MNEARLLDLIDAHFDDCLDDAGRAGLEAALAASPEARRVYWDCAGGHALLRELLTEERGRCQAGDGASASRRGAPVRSRRSRLVLTVAAAAAAALLAVAGLRLASNSSASRSAGPVAIANGTAAPLVRELADGTRLTLSPGARLVALGPDAARGVRQLIRLESRGVEIAAPPAPAGETACRVETPEGLWVETRGTTFRVERSFVDASGARSPTASASGAAMAALLLVTVSEGEVSAGRGEIAEAEVEVGAGGSAELRAITEHFKRRRAHWLKIAQEDEARRNPREMLELVRAWAELEDWEEARSACRRLLERFDPDGDSAGTPDAKLPDLERLRAAVAGPDFPTVEMVRLGKAKLAAICGAFFGVAGGAPAPRDYRRADGLIAAFLADFPRYGLDERGAAGEARRGLESLREEAGLRTILLVALGDLSTACLELGRRERREGRADAARGLFLEGAASAGRAAERLPRDAEIAASLAWCRLELGDPKSLEQAVEIFGKLRRSRENEDVFWWRCTRGLSGALVALGRREEALGLLRPLLLTAGEKTVRRHWPELPEAIRGLERQR